MEKTKKEKNSEEKVKEVKKEKKVEKKPEKEIKKEEKKEKSKSKKGLSKETKEKIFKGVGIAVFVLAILGLAFWVSSSYGEGTYDFVYIDIDQYLEYLNDDEARIIYIARPDCSYCQQETPIIKRLAKKYDLTLNYLDTTNFVERDDKGNIIYGDDGYAIYSEAGQKFMASADVYKDGWGTPNTIIVKDGKIVDGIYQYVPQNDLEDFFERNGFI